MPALPWRLLELMQPPKKLSLLAPPRDSIKRLPDCPACQHPSIKEAELEYLQGSPPLTVAREHEIDPIDFRRHLQRHGFTKRRAKNPVGSMVSLRDAIDVDRVLREASADALVKLLFEIDRFLAVNQGAVSDRHVLQAGGEVEEALSNLSDEELKLLEGKMQESIDAEFKEEVEDGLDLPSTEGTVSSLPGSDPERAREGAP